MALSDDETAVINGLSRAILRRRRKDREHKAYYEGRQRLKTLGLAVPPELAGFETVVNWPRVVVDELEHRLDVKAILLPGEVTEQPELREGWEANNLDSEASLLHRDALTYGRGFVTVGTNEDDEAHPLVCVESGQQMTMQVDARRRRAEAALRLYEQPTLDLVRLPEQKATLYLPNATIWLSRSGARWVEEDRDEHNLGVVPVVMFLNRRRTGAWEGESEMTDVIPLTDAAARSLTNLQVAQETHSVPQKWALGVSKGDFVDANGDPLPVWEAYFTSIWSTKSPDAKIGQLTPSDLKNFHSTVDFYARMMSSVTGFPARYFGQNPANPATEGAIDADESRMVKNAERKARDWGDGWGWVMGLYERFRTGEWPESNRIRVEYHDAGTPTFAQRADGISKLNGGVPVLSREGSWDELGWSDARKAVERERFEAQNSDPTLAAIVDKMAGLSDGDPAGRVA